MGVFTRRTVTQQQAPKVKAAKTQNELFKRSATSRPVYRIVDGRVIRIVYTDALENARISKQKGEQHEAEPQHRGGMSPFPATG